MSYQSFVESTKDVKGLMHRVVVDTFRKARLIGACQWAEVEEGHAGEEYQQLDKLPSSGPRALFGNYSRSTHRSTPGYEALRIYGSRIGFDRAGRKMGIQKPSVQIRAAAKSVAMTVESHMINGDPDTDPLQFGGLKYWASASGVTADTVISAGTTSGGAALAISLLRDAIDNCNEPNMIVCGTQMASLFAGAAENTALRGYFSESKDEFGRKVQEFDGLPIVPVDRDGTESQARILPFTEAASSGAATASSVFVVGNQPKTGWYPFQMGLPEVVNVEGASAQKDRDVEHLLATVAVHPRSVVRIQHIGQLEFVR